MYPRIRKDGASRIVERAPPPSLAAGWLNAFAPENVAYIVVTPDVSLMRRGEFHDDNFEF
eukprot:scaffold102724_cov29-Tisochrysis_lutea.AAC.1